MSAIPRLSRSRSKSPRHSPPSSPKRKPLHERSHSETNSIAGSTSTGPPPIKDDSDPVYSSSPFPRLPSQVLTPKGAPFIFEDSTAGTGGDENASAGPSSSRPSRVSKPRSPTGKGKARRSPRSSPRTSLEAARSRPGSVASKYGRGPPRDLTRPLDEVRHPQLARSNTRVRSIVSAIEASSVKSQSPPPTPRTPRTRSRGSRASITSRRYEIGSREAEAIFEANAPSLSRPSNPLSFSSLQDQPRSDRSPPPPTTEDATGKPNVLSEQPSQPHQSVEHRVVSEEPPLSAASSRHDLRPRSSSAPVAPTDALLAALIATGELHYPTLERPSAASLRTDSSSFRQAAPRPLQLRRQPARSNLALAQQTATDPSAYYEDGSLAGNRFSTAASYEAPSTPPQQVFVHPPSSGRWTPGRWDAEMEDDVPELQPHALRAQRSYRDSWADSRSDLRRSESVTSFQSASSTALPFYHFLNDSKTAWARAYYRGEGALPITTPPHVTLIRSLSARSARTPPSVHSRSASDPTDTPDSATYAQEVFVPRIRPFRNPRREPQRRLPAVPPQAHHEDIGLGSEDPELTPTADYAHRHLRQQASRSFSERQPWPRSRDTQDNRPHDEIQPQQVQAVPANVSQEPYNPQEPMPHLSPDRGNDDRISVWRPPSIEPQSLFGTVNRQILLFCVGFCFPFAWMLAAILPLPDMPPILRDDPETTPRPQSIQELNEAFNQQDVRRYQKARWWRVMNRAMSIVGTFVIAAIIALAVIGTR